MNPPTATPAPRFVTSHCQHCNGGIEFDAQELNASENPTVPCPHCGLETVIFVSPAPTASDATAQSLASSPIAAPPPPSFSPPESRIISENVMEIRLSSGSTLEVEAVRLYDESRLIALNAKKASAIQLSGGVSTGLGSIGSLGWVAASSLAIGAVESILSSAASKDAMKLFQEIFVEEEAIRKDGRFFPVHQIYGVQYPSPGLWRVAHTRNVAVSEQSTDPTKPPIFQVISSTFTYDGDEFVSVVDSDGSVYSIRWSAVENYTCKAKK